MLPDALKRGLRSVLFALGYPASVHAIFHNGLQTIDIDEQDFASLVHRCCQEAMSGQSHCSVSRVLDRVGLKRTPHKRMLKATCTPHCL